MIPLALIFIKFLPAEIFMQGFLFESGDSDSEMLEDNYTDF